MFPVNARYIGWTKLIVNTSSIVAMFSQRSHDIEGGITQ